MNREHRLTKTNEIKRVRLEGKSYAHPLLVLSAVKGSMDHTRVCVITGKSIGNAVKRNRARRRVKAILMNLLIQIKEPSDIVVIARAPISSVEFWEIQKAAIGLLKKAGLIERDDNRT